MMTAYVRHWWRAWASRRGDHVGRGEYQLSETVGLSVRAGCEAATVRLGERVHVNTLGDAEQASELVE